MENPVENDLNIDEVSSDSFSLPINAAATATSEAAAAGAAATSTRSGRRLRTRGVEGTAKKFLEDFNPQASDREMRKRGKKTAPAKAKARAKTNLYDDKGILIKFGIDMCDCMKEDCPGCHFPCQRCKSGKCGGECRNNRKWQYETSDIDGEPGTHYENPYLVNPVVRKPLPAS